MLNAEQCAKNKGDQIHGFKFKVNLKDESSADCWNLQGGLRFLNYTSKEKKSYDE